jgi:hypothetical protein
MQNIRRKTVHGMRFAKPGSERKNTTRGAINTEQAVRSESDDCEGEKSVETYRKEKETEIGG